MAAKKDNKPADSAETEPLAGSIAESIPPSEAASQKADIIETILAQAKAGVIEIQRMHDEAAALNVQQVGLVSILSETVAEVSSLRDTLNFELERIAGVHTAEVAVGYDGLAPIIRKGFERLCRLSGHGVGSMSDILKELEA